MAIKHKLANLNWVGLILCPLAVILMEAFWVYPWLAWIGRWPALVWSRPPLSLFSVIILLGIFFFVSRGFLTRGWSLHWVRLGIVACGLVAGFLVIRIEYDTGSGLLSREWFTGAARILIDSFSQPHPLPLALLAAAYLWWRGISYGRNSLYFDDIYHSFVVGFIALVLLLVVWRASSGAGSLDNFTATLGLYVAGFFFSGLVALALGNLQATREKILETGGTTPLLSRQWLSILLTVVGAIVLVGVGIASLFSSEFLVLLSRFLAVGYDLLIRIVGYLFVPIGYLVAGLVYAVQFIIGLFRRAGLVQPSQSQNMTELEPPPEIIPRGLSAEALLAIKWTILALIAIAVVFFLVRAIFRQWSVRAGKEIEEISESVWTWDGFKADLRLFLSLIWRPFRRKRKGKAQRGSPSGGQAGEDVPGMLAVREIYRRLLREASDYGIERRSDETPSEYARRFGQILPEGSVPLDELTSLYIGVRYGEMAVESKQVEQANSLWRWLRQLLKEGEDKSELN
ncbi:MAG: hypothetical protein HW402_1046 [Dehalococcoidales bacterium]|nr:hypothetical protein [Dehalococcoidales bacterium]